MSVIKQGSEPVAFKSYFVAWEPQMWNKKMSYEDQLKAIKKDNEKVDENAWTMVWCSSNLLCLVCSFLIPNGYFSDSLIVAIG